MGFYIKRYFDLGKKRLKYWQFLTYFQTETSFKFC